MHTHIHTCILLIHTYIRYLAQINEQRKTLEQQSLFLEKVVGDKKAMLTKKTTLLEQVQLMCFHAHVHIHSYTHTKIHTYIHTYIHIHVHDNAVTYA